MRGFRRGVSNKREERDLDDTEFEIRLLFIER